MDVLPTIWFIAIAALWIGYLLLVQRYPAKAFETGKASA